ILIKLSNRLGTLLDGDSVKDFVARMDARGGTKKLNLLAYRLYSKWKGFKFDLPMVGDTEAQLPFIPLETELDSLIAGSGKKLASILQILKITGCRVWVVTRSDWVEDETDYYI